MNSLENFVHYNKLLETYGLLLTDSQREMMELYYEFNLSLAEIAENKGISRSAVSDALKKASQALENYENKLKIIENNAKIDDLLEKIENSNNLKDIKNLVNDFKRN